MALKKQLQKLATEKSSPCVTISMNTHRTHPDNAQDDIQLKNFLKEAEDRVISEFGKRPASQLLENIESIRNEIDSNFNLDSLHIFLSNDTQEFVRSSWESNNTGVHISDRFAIRPLILHYNRSERYLVMLLSQGGVHLYEAINDTITKEVMNDDFPYMENTSQTTHLERMSDSKHLDDLVREYLNKVDKALVRVHDETELKCVVIATEDNYSRLQQVADKPGVYIGYASYDYSNEAPHQIVKQSWELVRERQTLRRAEAISDMREAVAHGTVLTDLHEIYQASIDGRGDLLIVHQDFSQAVLMKDERTFELADDPLAPNVIDDITSLIAWEVMSKKGNVIFTLQDEIKDLGKIVLKTRY